LVQLGQAQAAFYAGAHGMLWLLTSALSPGGEVTAADQAMLAEIREELDEFFAEPKGWRI
jgi:hypothetical protein